MGLVLLLVTNHGIAFLRHQGYIATTNNIHPPFPACFVPSIVLQFLHVLNHLTFRNSRLRVSVLLPSYRWQSCIQYHPKSHHQMYIDANIQQVGIIHGFDLVVRLKISSFSVDKLCSSSLKRGSQGRCMLTYASNLLALSSAVQWMIPNSKTWKDNSFI